MLRFFTAGESHGKGLTVIIEGIPANVPVSIPQIQEEMKKRKTGLGSGGRQLIEDDSIEITSGVRFGKTLGSPIAIYIENKDFKNWGKKMSAETQPQEFIDEIKVLKPRPGHADLAGIQKYNFDDVRNVLERASARETTGRVAAGAIFKQFLNQFDIEIASHTTQIGQVKLNKSYTFEDVKKSYDIDPETRCIDTVTANKMKELISTTRSNMNTLGGVIEIWANNVIAGLGSYVHFDRKIDGQLAQALMSIQSVKAVEIGDGINASGAFGTEVHDEIYYSAEIQEKKGYYRKTNRAGGIEGGVTNGMPVIARVYHKPISTIYKPLNTVNIKTKHEDKATVERSDICVVPRAGVISESMMAYVIANNLIEKFGADENSDIIATYSAYRKRIA